MTKAQAAFTPKQIGYKPQGQAKKVVLAHSKACLALIPYYISPSAL